MPTVILRGNKNGQRIARLVLEGSSSNPVRYGDINGAPFEVTDEEFVRLDQQYMLEPANGRPDSTEETPLRPEEGSDGDDNEHDEPEKGGVK